MLSNLIHQIDDFAAKSFIEWQIPGAAIGIVHNGEILHLKGYGQKGSSNPDPITPSTLFPTASISKGMSAAAIAVLVNRGILQWNQKVIEILPHFKLYDPWVTKECTIIDLFCHRSGLPPDPLQQLPLWGYSGQDLKNLLPQVKPIASFRTTYQYVNILYLFIEEIIEHLTKISFAEFMDAHVFKPIGMNTSAIGLKNADNDKNLIQGHILDEETFSKVQQISFSCYPQIFMAAGGAVATPSDLCRWMLAQLGHIKFLPKADLHYMWRPQTVINEKEFYGLGWRSLMYKPSRIVSHGGLIKGIRHLLYLVPELDFGIFVLTNLTHSDAPRIICEHATDLLMKIDSHYQQSRTIFMNDLKGDCPAPVCDISYDPSIYIGEYENSILGRAKVVCEGMLKLYFAKVVAHLQPIGLGQFRIYFPGKSGADIGEGHWGTATFNSKYLVLKAYKRFDFQEFHFQCL